MFLLWRRMITALSSLQTGTAFLYARRASTGSEKQPMMAVSVSPKGQN